MSIHFSYADLYKVINSNDLKGLEKAILFLGARIHVAEVCCGRTAMQYAAQLGHLDQVKLLLQEFERYDRRNDPRIYDYHSKLFKEYLEHLLYDLIPHRDVDQDFLISIVNIIKSECEPTSGDKSTPTFADSFSDKTVNIDGAVERLIDLGDFGFLKKIVELSPKQMKVISTYAVIEGKSSLRDWITTDDSYVEKMREQSLKCPLMHSIKFKELEEISQLLDRAHNVQINERVFRSGMYGYEDAVKHAKSENTLLFVVTIAKTNSADVLALLLEAANLRNVSRITGLSEENFIEDLFRAALVAKSSYMVEAMLNHDKLSMKVVDMHELYVYRLTNGDFHIAEILKPFCGALNQEQVRLLSNRLRAVRGISSPLDKLGSPKEAEAAANALESFYASDYPLVWETLRKDLCEYPKLRGRCDLLTLVRRFGVTYSEKEVIQGGLDNKMLLSGCPVRALDRILAHWDNPGLKRHIDYIPDDRSPGRTPRAYFLGGRRKPLTLDSFYDVAEGDIALLRECVKQSGKMIVHPFHASRAVRNLVKELETERRASLTLQKLCRLTIRERVRQLNCGSLTDALLRLYVGGHLSMNLMNFVLFRDDNQGQPLYYRSIKFFRTSSSHDFNDYPDEPDYDY